MELVRWEQVEGVNRIQSRINELFEDTFGRTRAQQGAATGVWYPPVDILESKDSYIIRAELPGMRNEDLKTEVNEGVDPQRREKVCRAGQWGRVPPGRAGCR